MYLFHFIAYFTMFFLIIIIWSLKSQEDINMNPI